MDISERNKKVALARWENCFIKQRERIKKDPSSLIKKAIICGFLAGDGNIQIRRDSSNYEIRFFPDDAYMLQVYCELMEELYDKCPSVFIEKGSFNARLTSKVIVEDIISYSNFGLEKWDLPEELFLIPNAKEYWISAFFSGEAYVGKNHIKVQTINKSGMEKLSNLLFDCGINHKFYQYCPKRSNHSIVYIICILKKKDRKLFYDKIGFFHREKTIKLQKSLNL
ncbi:hypothetical protein HOD38_00075 [archaeon]|jgi:hypothetical protein|nr:hypothetical protein [archaeon]MBT4396643.1 hypothetical protein [archaeon]MBT4441253.1 hypothetical protein [archaeon]